MARPSRMVLILSHSFGVYRQSSLECAGTLSAGLALPVSLHEYMGLHTSSAKALFRHPPPPLLFPPFSLSLKGADQFTASSGGVRLIPALCDWLRRHKPSVVRSRSLSPLCYLLWRAAAYSFHLWALPACGQASVKRNHTNQTPSSPFCLSLPLSPPLSWL